mmetsp:Transcript_123831/g.246367  ORF Transcript_123831/g.246367 Transcript_123831/m.246367 type:complete len:449 (-) Transcript_123831:103-1449(-)|eukprot:CAMPEP_0172692372 /NCGR_PEP_ID=MMETSP1074-20121228/25204_1 /TAXON_ID=2916 /ORGANISM="Ceratium fusus, Strain PA161109" /LENGTH=448 /DNA_ID=CAMNT_0013512567 /DNA_START=90 /DNA_END=1436 /DNA_ORIENTATION=-
MEQQDAAHLHTVGDKVTIIYELFDQDKNGRISETELKRVMQALDQTTWTDHACDQLWSAVDRNGDGHVQFTELWSWICGHGEDESKKANNSLQELLFGIAIQQKEEHEAACTERRKSFDMMRMQQLKDAEEKAKTEAEMAVGLRMSRKMFEEQYMALGMQQDAIRDLFRSADDDGNGELDFDEMGVMAANRLATVGQIKGMVCQNAQSANKDPQRISQLVDVFSKWDADGNGTISSQELTHVIRVLNPELTEATVARMMKEADGDENGSVDILEFVTWLCGNPKKKKEQEEQDARVLATLHRSRYQEAIQMGRVFQFEEMQHAQLEQWCAKTRMTPCCNTANKLNSTCQSCQGRHGWFCHGCGFVMFSNDCVHSCSPGEFPWTCLVGTCRGKKCGCKKKADVWRRTGFALDRVRMGWSVRKQLQVFTIGKLEDDSTAEGVKDPSAVPK